MNYAEYLLISLFCITVTLCAILLALKLRLFDRFFKSSIAEVIVQQTPCEQLTTHYLNKYGKFSLNRMWQLDSKIRNNKPLTVQETQFIRVCLMREHSIWKTVIPGMSTIFVDDNKMHDCVNKWSIELEKDTDEWLTV